MCFIVDYSSELPAGQILFDHASNTICNSTVQFAGSPIKGKIVAIIGGTYFVLPNFEQFRGRRRIRQKLRTSPSPP